MAQGPSDQWDGSDKNISLWSDWEGVIEELNLDNIMKNVQSKDVLLNHCSLEDVLKMGWDFTKNLIKP